MTRKGHQKFSTSLKNLSEIGGKCIIASEDGGPWGHVWTTEHWKINRCGNHRL